MSPTGAQTTPSPAEAVMAELDMELVRASMVNCVLMADSRLRAAHPDFDLAVAFYRIEELSVLFCMTSVQFARTYRLRLVNPDGSECQLVRFSQDAVPVPVELDEFDQEVVGALSQSLTATVGDMYEKMVKPPCKPTHSGVTTLQ